MSQIHLLYDLQQLDNEIREKKQRLVQVLHAQKESEELRAARTRQEEAAAELRQAQVGQRELELELGSLDAKARRSEERMYSGKVKNPKELSDLQQEVASLGRRRSYLEDDLLEVMLLVEECQVEEEQAGEALRAMETAWAERLAALQQEQEALAAQINTLLERRQAQVARIDGKLVTAYQAVGSRRGGVAVAALKDEMCQACGVRASASKVRAARVGDLVYCGSCGRILALIQ